MKQLFFYLVLTTFYFLVSIRPTFAASVADWQALDKFDQISDSAINVAKSKRVLFLHRSVGGQINSGFNCLQGTNYEYDPKCSGNPDYKYNRRKWSWQLFDTADVPAKIAEFESTVNAQINNYDVFGMKFCYIDWWYQDFARYRDMMLRLENTHTTKKFIWTTQALYNDWNHSLDRNAIKSFNDQLRIYAVQNNKPLYDLANIESHQANGTACTQNLGGIIYEIICPEWRVAPDDSHLGFDGGVRLAKGFWWLMANLDSSATITPTITPMIGDLDHNGRVDIYDYNILVTNIGRTGTPGFHVADLNNSGNIDIYDYNILVQDFGRIR